MTDNTKTLWKIFNRFWTCGIKHIVENGENETIFIFKGGMKKRITRVKITYDIGLDLWNVEFGKIFKHDYKKISEFKGVYTEDLRSIFEKETGYYVTLY